MTDGTHEDEIATDPAGRAMSDLLSAALAGARKAEHARAETMPDEEAALTVMFQAYQRLKELGFRDAMYCPKDGTPFDAIEAGSTGIHNCHYDGEWPTGRYWVADAGDLWPSQPILYRDSKGT